MKKIFDDIYVGSNIISKLNDYTKDFDKILIFSHETIADLYFEKFKSTLKEKDELITPEWDFSINQLRSF